MSMAPKPPSASPFKRVSTRAIYQNPWISVHEDHVIRPGGQQGIFGIVTMKAGASVLPITDDLQTFLTSEYKYAVGRTTLEVVSGAIEAGESPLEAGKREPEEELGIQAEEWVDMGCIDPFTTVVSSPNHMFVAMGLNWTSQKLDEGEVLSIVKMSFAEALASVMRGDITHGASCVVILKTSRLLQSRGLLPRLDPDLR